MILVTGGGGFIGRHIVDLLLERDEPVRILDSNLTTSFPDSVEVLHGSVTDPPMAAKAMKNVRCVFHVAGNPQLWDRDKGSFERINAGGTRTILSAAAEHGVERFVHTSSSAVLALGLNARNADHAVDFEPCAGNALGAYARSKLEAEKEVWKAIKGNFPAIIVRPTLPVGPGDHYETPPTKMLTEFLNGKNAAFMECELNLIDVRDVARGHIRAAVHGQLGSAYLLGNETFRLSRLLRTLEQLTGVKMPRVRVPFGVALAAAAVSEFFADHFTQRPPLATTHGVRLAHRLRPESPRRDPLYLGMTLTPIRKSLMDTIDWLVANGRIDTSRFSIQMLAQIEHRVRQMQSPL